KDRQQTRRLRVGQSEEGSRVDTDEFDQEARHAGENQIIGKNLAARFGAAQGFGAHVPKEGGDGEPDEQFVERGWINAAIGWPAQLHAGIGGGDHTVRERHSPGPLPGGGLAVIAVSGKKAADASDSVTYTSRGGANIEKQ